MRSVVIVPLLLITVWASNYLRPSASAIESSSMPKSSLMVAWEPLVIVNGSPCMFRVRSRQRLRSLSGEWQGRRIFFDFDARDGTWYGFGGVGTDAVSGQHQLALEATTASGARFFNTFPVTVGKANYQTIALSVPRQFTEPDSETLARINEEQAFKREVFKRVTPSKLWSGEFAAPVGGPITDDFGTRRTFNGRVQSSHQGMDFRADTGTPVAAMNNGAVIVARELFYEGGFVVIDHGQGLLTLYMHLSEIIVREGDRVAKKQIVGLSGGTGRVTAPHLHVGIRWQGVYINPETLLNMQLP